jgi:hypothetical protein
MLSTEKTLSEVIEILRLRGYTEDFNLLEENISYKIGGEKVNLSDIVIDKIYRFTGLNDLEDEAILYAMRNQKDGAKGFRKWLWHVLRQCSEQHHRANSS